MTGLQAHREGAKTRRSLALATSEAARWLGSNPLRLRAFAVRFGFCLCLSAAAAVAQETVGTGSPAVGSPGGIAAAAEAPKHPIQISGYAILDGAWTQSDPGVVSI